MVVQIERRNERADTMGGQTNTAPAGACNTDRSLTINAVKERVTAMPHPINSQLHIRSRIAQSILSHRGGTEEGHRDAIMALEGAYDEPSGNK